MQASTVSETAICIGCGNPFPRTNGSKKRCVKNCGRSHSTRTLKRLTNDITFVGVDGEGVDRPDGIHEYVMLSVGSRTLWKDGRQLTLAEILAFLWECYTDEPEAAYVGFFLGYDFTQWLKLLPEREARLLFTTKGMVERKSQRKSRANPFPDAVVWEGWEIDIMANRRFKLRPHTHHRSEYSGLCRNRTCRLDMGNADWDALDDGEPEYIVPGEMEFTPDDNSEGTEWVGSFEDFWKQFRVKAHTVGTGEQKAKVSGWLYICDTGPFWQTSFLNVINPKKWDTPVCTEDEYALITKGKNDRGNGYSYGETTYFADMQMYNVLENEILARVTTRLNQGLVNETIPIKLKRNEWYGPGRAAQTWMDMLHARLADSVAVEHNKYVARSKAKDPFTQVERANEGGLLNADVYMSMPSWFYDAAQASYYGGWFEQFMHGHVGNVWEYDINSAYPFIIASLPCLHTTGDHNGRYEQGIGNDYPTSTVERYTLVRGSVQGSNPFVGAMPYRTRTGNILRPHVTKGWYWLHEIDAAKRAELVETIDVEEWVSYLPCECPPPFNRADIGIGRMYQMRLDVGKNSPQGIAAKLVYNSAYGKTAQSVGSPKYSNPVYASLITAGCRTLILEAIASHPNGASAVSMVATDGVYFTSPHMGLPLDVGRLGAWDETVKTNLTQLMPGVYWDDKTRETIARAESPKMKSRGVNAKDLSTQIAHLDDLFADAHLSLATGGEYEWPTITFHVKFLMDSAKLALQRGKWNTAGRVTHGSTRSISSNPYTKRIPDAYRCPDTGITRTRPYAQWDTIESTPYQKAFGFVNPEELQFDQDGTDGMQYFRDLMKGMAP